MDKEYKDRGLAILGFPCNQFGGQEPGTNAQVAEFAAKKGVQFELFEKCDVNGANSHEVYKYLRCNSILFDPKVKKCREIPWNFSKFLVNVRSSQVKYYEPRTDPFSLRDEIEKQLSQLK